MKIIKQSGSAIFDAIKILKKGGLVIAPSDTVYGALVDAQNHEAVKKLIAFKNRPWGKPISVFVENESMMEQYVAINDKQKKLLSNLLPGPFTVVLDSLHKADKLLESERGSLGVRLIDYPFIHNLVKAFGHPVTATSANLSGRNAHHSIDSLLKEFSQKKKDMVDLIIDAGKLPRNMPSTVIDITSTLVKIMRQGDLGIKDYKTFISKSTLDTEKIAQHLINKLLNKLSHTPLVFILEGDMGVGKTVFVKGVGKLFGITDIISPTYVISYEYVIGQKEVNKLIHCDFFNIDEPQEFQHLGLNQYLVQGNIFFIEWGEKAGDLYELLKSKAHIVHIKMEYGKDKEREINISS